MKVAVKGDKMLASFQHEKKKAITITVWPGQFSQNFQIQKSWKKKGSEEWVREKVGFFKEELEALQSLIAEALSTDLEANYVEQNTDKPESKQQKFIEPTHAAAVADDDIPF